MKRHSWGGLATFLEQHEEVDWVIGIKVFRDKCTIFGIRLNCKLQGSDFAMSVHGLGTIRPEWAQKRCWCWAGSGGVEGSGAAFAKVSG